MSNDEMTKKFLQLLKVAETPPGASDKPAKPPLPPSDGRRRRKTGRVEQLNVKVHADTKTRFIALAEARGLSMGGLLEQLLLQAETGAR